MKGTYILIIFLKNQEQINIGSLGKILFKNGYYFYIGSAMGNIGSTTLINRVKRHIIPTEQKKLHWHIDHLLTNRNSKIIKVYLVPSSSKLECLLAQELLRISDEYIEKFGSSDCKCISHCFYFKDINDFYKRMT
jgi:Uri superfamily endonuclease